MHFETKSSPGTCLTLNAVLDHAGTAKPNKTMTARATVSGAYGGRSAAI